ncbi:restriction endonuclease subunit S [Aliarcobacter butzleri]
MSSWKECKLGDVAKLSKKTWKVGDELMPYIGLEHIEESKLRLNAIGNSENVASNKFRFQAGDTLFGKLRPYFRKVIKPSFDGICSTDIWVLNPQKGIDKDFLFYFFANQELVDISYSASSGTRMPRADWDFLSQTVWNIPPLEEQKAIAEVLSSLDDKIDLLHRQNQTLESLAQTLFRQWFIEEVKEEWEVGILGDYIDIIDNRGKTPPFLVDETEYPIIEVNALSGESRLIKYSVIKKYVTEEIYNSWFRAGHPKIYDTLLSTVGSIGEIAMFLLKKGSIAQNVVALRAKNISPFYLYENIKFIQNELKELDIGSVQPSIKVTHLAKIDFVKPDDEILKKFDEQMMSISTKIIVNSQQIKTLENLRDRLLPKLLSGEVRVKI